MVFICHNPFSKVGPGTLLPEWANAFLETFSIGVSIFFVLSGFLITLRYAENIQLSRNWIVKYTRNRMARIYPMYFLVTIATFAASQFSLAYDPSRVWKYFSATDKGLALFLNLTFLRGFFSNFCFTLAGQGWSLTVEETFYLIAPFILLTAGRRVKLLPVWAVGLLATGFALAAIGHTWPTQLYGFFKNSYFMLNWTFFGRCLEFIAGMALGLWVLKHPAQQRASSWLTYGGVAWILSCMLILTRFTFGVPAADIPGLTYAPAIILHNLVLPVGIVALFWGLMHEQSSLRRILETKLFDLLGKSSYAFYLVHVGILNFFIEYNLTTNVWIKFVLMNVVSIALYKLVEHPVHRWLVSGKPAQAARLTAA